MDVDDGYDYAITPSVFLNLYCNISSAFTFIFLFQRNIIFTLTDHLIVITMTFLMLLFFKNKALHPINPTRSPFLGKTCHFLCLLFYRIFDVLLYF